MTVSSDCLYIALKRNTMCLLWDQMGPKEQRLYTVTMMPVHPDEAGFKTGRFRYFQPDRQECSIMVSPATGQGSDPWQVVVARLINWIAEQEESAEGWSLTVQMRSVFDGDLLFSFADGALAVLFALKFT